MQIPDCQGGLSLPRGPHLVLGWSELVELCMECLAQHLTQGQHWVETQPASMMEAPELLS